jgi:hypothetical protein
VGKETDRKWEEGDDISVMEFKITEYGRAKEDRRRDLNSRSNSRNCHTEDNGSDENEPAHDRKAASW